MTAISLDRYLGISSPLKIRNKSKFVVLLKIFIVWILTVVISCPLAVLSVWNPDDIYYSKKLDDQQNGGEEQFFCQINNSYYMIYGSTLAFLIPFIIMLITYIRTTQLLKQQALLLGGGYVGVGGEKNSSSSKIVVCNEGLRRSRTKRNSSKKRSSSKPTNLNLLQRQQTPSFDAEETMSTTNSIYSERTYLTIGGCGGVASATVLHHSSSADDEDSTIFALQQLPVSNVVNNRNSNKKKKLFSLSQKEQESRPFLPSSNSRQQQQEPTPNLKTRLKLLTFNKQGRKGRSFGVGVKDLHHHSTSSSSSAAEVANEQKATRVLGLVFACFFVCWTPFFALNFTYAFCADQCQAPFFIETTFLWLGFVSSVINPIIYTVFNKKFRQAFKRIVKCRWKTIKQSPSKNSNSFSATFQQRMSRTNSQQQHQHNGAGGRSSQKISSVSNAGRWGDNNYSNNTANGGQ